VTGRPQSAGNSATPWPGRTAGGLRVRVGAKPLTGRDGVVGGHEDVCGPALRPRRGDQPLHFVAQLSGVITAETHAACAEISRSSGTLRHPACGE